MLGYWEDEAATAKVMPACCLLTSTEQLQQYKLSL